MKIADRTPFRTESGEIDIMGRAQGTLKYGLSWYARLQAQDVVIKVLDKVLGANFVLLRNVTLPDTDIDLPLVLIGPPGIYLINVTHERGVYRARDEEWGTVSGDKLVPAGINQLQRTVKLGRVLQVYLDRAGYKNTLIVEPILMAADPGMHIESVRPAARIVMSDALERFAISMNQARPTMTAEAIAGIARVVVNGPKKKEAPASKSAAVSAPIPANGGLDTTGALFSSAQKQDATSAFSADALDFSFDEDASDRQSADRTVSQPQRPAPRPAVSTGYPGASEQNSSLQAGSFGEVDFRSADAHSNAFTDDSFSEPGSQTFERQDPDATIYNFSETSDPAQSAAQPEGGMQLKSSPGQKRRLFGMSTGQLIFLGVILLIWVCAMLAFAAYIYYSSLNV